MIRNRRTRRIVSACLLVLGGALMLFAPEQVWAGAVLLALGVLLELVAIAMARGGTR